MSVDGVDPWTGLTAIEAFEIRAEAFRIMTSHMAPGKDAPAMGGFQARPDVVREAFEEWHQKYHGCVRAVMAAYRKILPRSEE